jgi:hypothetical protein
MSKTSLFFNFESGFFMIFAQKNIKNIVVALKIATLYSLGVAQLANSRVDFSGVSSMYI